VRAQVENSEEFMIDHGLRQWDVLSADLFSLVL
jgi:hypothetical protein